jgi:DNA-binding response OmpR family regulator
VTTNRPVRLILVEDDPPLADLLLDLMADEGIEAAPVPTAADALALAGSGPWDVCLLGASDRSNPSAPAPEALAPLATRVPVIVTTVHDWARGVDPAELGVAAVLAKPFDLDALLATVGAAAGVVSVGTPAR